MKLHHLATITGLLLSTSAAQAIGLGDIDVYSALNEPLRAEVEVHGATSQNIEATLLAPTLFTNPQVADQFATTTLKIAHNTDNNPVIVITGQLPLTEPFLHFNLTVASASDRLRNREYAILLDPPGTTYLPRAPLMDKPMMVEPPIAPAAGQLPDPLLDTPADNTPPWPADGGIDIDLTSDGGVDIDLVNALEVNLTPVTLAVDPMISNDLSLQPEPLPNGQRNGVIVPLPTR